MALLPLAGWAESYEVKVRAMALDIYYGAANPTGVQSSMFMVTDWAGYPGDVDDKATVSDAIKAKLSFTSERAANSNVGNIPFTLSVADGDFVQYGGDYFFINIANANGTFKQLKADAAIIDPAPVYATGLVYNDGNDISLLNAEQLGTATVGTITVDLEYAISTYDGENWSVIGDEDWGADNYKVTNAGKYQVYYRAVESDNYTFDPTPVPVGTTYVAVDKATNSITGLTLDGWTYDPAKTEPSATGENPAITINATVGAANAVFTYAKKTSGVYGEAGTYDDKVGGHAGTYKLIATIPATNNYTEATREVEFTIAKATPVLNVDGVINTAWNLYDDANHNLFLKRATATIGETTLGNTAISYNARYKAPGDSYGGWFGAKTNPTNSNFTNKKDAGSYQVQIWVEATDDYNAVYHKPNNEFARIDVAQADITGYTEPVAKTGLRANGTHALVEAATWGENTPAGTFAYSLNGTDWVADVPTASVAGDYTVYFKMTPTAATNYNVFTNSYAVSIAAANPAYIIPAAKSKMYGQSTDPELTYTVVDGDGNALEKTVLKGTVTLARELGNAVGQYIIYVQKYEPGENEDYDVLNVLNTPGSTDAANKTAFFSIIADPNNTLKLKFTDEAVATKVYDGTTAVDLDNDDLEIESGALGTDTWETLKGSANITFALKTTEGEAPANANVGNYQVVATYSDGLVNYANVEIAPLAYTITKKPLAVVVEDQTIDYGAPIASDNWALAVGSAYAVGEDNDNAGIVLYTAQAINKYEPGSVNDGAIMAKIEGDSNYEIAAEGNTWGKLSINAGADLVLNSDADDLDKINAFDGQTVNVTIDFTARNARTLGGQTRPWKAEEWVVLTLPFDISVSELSQKLGYAIVNVIDPDRTEINGTSSKFYGKLTMKGGNGNDTKLAANKPFLVKTVGNIEIVDFGSQLIVAPENEEALSVDAGLGAKFTGTYTTKEVSKTDEAKIWFMLSGFQNWAYVGTNASATWNIVPLEGFIDMKNASSEVNNIKFFFEEEDGTVTAIESVNAEGANSAASAAAEGWYTINGVKLEAKPTQKGIYIFNGKKVAIQ